MIPPVLSVYALAIALVLVGDPQGDDQAQLEVKVVGLGRVEMLDGRICYANSTCWQPVGKGTSVRLRVLQEPGVDGRFAGWDGVCRGVSGPECVVTVRVGARVMARFK